MAKDTLSKEDQIFPEINKYAEQLEKTGAFDARWYAGLREELSAIAAKNVCFADSRRAFLASISGKKDDYAAAIKNLKANQYLETARREEYGHLLNHGYATAAFELIQIVIDERHLSQTIDIFEAVFSNGGYQFIHDYVFTANERKEALHPNPIFLKVKEVVQVMEQLNVNDIDIVKMKDVAGELLREHNRVWAGRTTHVTTLTTEQGGPQLLIEYFVGVTPALAAKMSWDLTERLIYRDLYKNSISLNFLGIAA